MEVPKCPWQCLMSCSSWMKRDQMKMPSSCQCIWCGDLNNPLAEGKKYCTECSCSCKQECKTCHKPYPNLKYFHVGADRCKYCSTHHEKRKMYTKNEAIALAKATKGKSKIPNDDRGEESDEFPPPQAS